MNHKRIVSWLSLLLLLPVFALAEAPQAYTLPYEGSMFEVFFLPGGDILHYGSYGRQVEDGRYADSVVRSTPDGAVVWEVHLPYEDMGIGLTGGLAALPDGRYMSSEAVDEDTMRILFFDAEEGLVGEAEAPLTEHAGLTIREGMLMRDAATGEDRIRMRWLDLEGKEIRSREYAFAGPEDTYLMLLETEDALYMLAQTYNTKKPAETSLMKLTEDGLLRWKKAYDAPNPYFSVLTSDGADGVMMIGGNGMYDETTHYPYTALRIDAEGETIWEQALEIGEWVVRKKTAVAEGVQMIWETDDVFKFVTLDREGVLTDGPTYVKPNADMEGVSCWVGGCVQDETGRQWVHCTLVREIDPYHTEVTPLLQPLDAYPLWQED